MVAVAVTTLARSSNSLVDKTGYVKATEVQGDSFELGAKVVYQGREMLVIKGVDSDGELRMLDSSGLKILAEVLPQTKVTSLKCATSDSAIWPSIPPSPLDTNDTRLR